MTDSPATAPVRAAPEYLGPSGFRWMRPGLLGGTPMPGIVTDMAFDLEALERVGTRLLVSLTDEWTPDPARFAGYGIESLHVPMPDREPPTIEQARETCRVVAERMARGEAVVHHCKAGRGRTGTLIAAQLVHEGMTGEQAVEAVRERNPSWIQSDSQIDFLADFARALAS